MITHAVGISLAPNSSTESGVAVRELSTNKLIYMDKLFSISDVELFFNNYNNLKNSIICVSLPWDNTMLEGKWRILSKPYQLIHEHGNFHNKDNWMERFSSRGSDLLLNLSKNGAEIYRYEVYLSRQKLNLYSNFKEHSTADCKFLQSALRLDYGFEDLPQNMIPAAQLEAVVGTLVAEKKLNSETGKIFDFKDLAVINIL
jgi:hypothetical protein